MPSHRAPVGAPGLREAREAPACGLEGPLGVPKRTKCKHHHEKRGNSSSSVRADVATAHAKHLKPTSQDALGADYCGPTASHCPMGHWGADWPVELPMSNSALNHGHISVGLLSKYRMKVLIDRVVAGGPQLPHSSPTFPRGTASSGYGASTGFRDTPTSDFFFDRTKHGMVPVRSGAQQESSAT